MMYRIARIPKGNGKFRTIYVPTDSYAAELRELCRELEEIATRLDTGGAGYAFTKGRNCALNAMQHIGYRYTLTMDLKDFFDSISPKHVAGLIPRELIIRCFVDGNPKQGLPTSPIISTIAFLACDKDISRGLKRLGGSFAYTRYADDLIVSFDDARMLSRIKLVLTQAVEQHGFKINERKTKVQDSKNGRVVITGIAVDEQGLHATRRTKKKLRAARHQSNLASARALDEWSKCKLPREFFT